MSDNIRPNSFYFQSIVNKTFSAAVVLCVLLSVAVVDSSKITTATHVRGSIVETVSGDGHHRRQYSNCRIKAPPILQLGRGMDVRGGSSPSPTLSSTPQSALNDKEPRADVVVVEKGEQPEQEEEVNDADDGNGNHPLPTLFRLPEEDTYDRYAACLAATEGLRNVRDRELSKTKQGFFQGVLSKTPLMGSSTSSRAAATTGSEAQVRAESKYILNSSKVIKALGLSVPQFNQVGREVMADEELKEKVMEQAYLYRLSANLSLPNNRVPVLSDPASSPLLHAHRRRRIQMFARSITEIEHLRTDQMEKLRKALQLPTSSQQLPDNFNICDPNIMPLLSPKVRAVCEAFPLQAEDIVRKYGLNSDEFNEMLEKTKKDPLFRWKVKKEMDDSSNNSDDGEVGNTE